MNNSVEEYLCFDSLIVSLLPLVPAIQYSKIEFPYLFNSAILANLSNLFKK